MARRFIRGWVRICTRCWRNRGNTIRSSLIFGEPCNHSSLFTTILLKIANSGAEITFGARFPFMWRVRIESVIWIRRRFDFATIIFDDDSFTDIFVSDTVKSIRTSNRLCPNALGIRENVQKMKGFDLCIHKVLETSNRDLWFNGLMLFNLC